MSKRYPTGGAVAKAATGKGIDNYPLTSGDWDKNATNIIHKHGLGPKVGPSMNDKGTVKGRELAVDDRSKAEHSSFGRTPD